MSAPWIVTGSAAAAGVFWIVQGALHSFSIGMPGLIISAAAAGLATGGLIASHAPVRPTREPLLAGLGGMGLVFLSVLAMTRAGIDTMPSVQPVSMQVLAVLVGGGGSLGGAAVMRRLKGVSTTALSVVLLSAAVHFGMLLALYALALLVFGHGDTGAIVMAFGGVFVAGFLTQLAIPVRAPWASASGVILLPVFGYLNDESNADLLSLTVGAALLLLVGRLGSAIANAIVKRPLASDLPQARSS